MFKEVTSFNQDIGSWDVSKGTNFVSVPLTYKEINLFDTTNGYSLLMHHPTIIVYTLEQDVW